MHTLNLQLNDDNNIIHLYRIYIIYWCLWGHSSAGIHTLHNLNNSNVTGKKKITYYLLASTDHVGSGGSRAPLNFFFFLKFQLLF